MEIHDRRYTDDAPSPFGRRATDRKQMVRARYVEGETDEDAATIDLLMLDLQMRLSSSSSPRRRADDIH